MPTNHTFEVTCSETITYKFPVIAKDETEAQAIAHKMLLGDETGIGAIRFAWPDGKALALAVQNRDWKVAKAQTTNDSAIDLDTADAFVIPYPMDAGLLVTEEYIRDRLAKRLEGEDMDCFLLGDEDIDDAATFEQIEIRREDLTERIILTMRDKAALKKRLAATIWDGSEKSSRLQTTIDDCVMEFATEFIQANGYLK